MARIVAGAWEQLRDTVQSWMADRVPLFAASLAYFTIFSLAPLLIIVIALIGLVFGEGAAHDQLVAEIQRLMGPTAAEAIDGMVRRWGRERGNIWATIIGIVTLLLGATLVFVQLQGALNAIWHVKQKPRAGWWNLLRTRLLSFGMVLVVGFLLLVSLVASATINALSAQLSDQLPQMAGVWRWVNLGVSLALIIVLFAMIYRYLPDVRLAWRHVLSGALVAAVLFAIGKYAIGFYLGNSAIGSRYGAAGSLVILLIWIYWSAQILLFGAEFSRVRARRRGDWIVPTSNAVSCDDEPDGPDCTPEEPKQS